MPDIRFGLFSQGDISKVPYLVAFIASQRTLNRVEKKHLTLLLKTAWIGMRMKIYVASCGEQVVGCVLLSSHDSLFGPRWYVENLMVAAECKDHGVGHRLMRMLGDDARKAGIRKIYMTRDTFQVGGSQAYYDSIDYDSAWRQYRVDMFYYRLAES